METVMSEFIPKGSPFIRDMNDIKLTQDELSAPMVTANYGIFNKLISNREPDHFMTIVNSIKKRDLTAYNPILVNENMDIIDGGNRFAACKFLNKAIHFQIGRGLTQFDVPFLNSSQRDWSLKNYLHCYNTQGYEEYVRLQERIVKFQHLPLDTIVEITGNQQYDAVDKVRLSVTKTFKAGSFKPNHPYKLLLDIDRILRIIYQKQRWKQGKLSHMGRALKRILLYTENTNEVIEQRIAANLEKVFTDQYTADSLDYMLLKMQEVMNKGQRGEPIIFTKLTNEFFKKNGSTRLNYLSD